MSRWMELRAGMKPVTLFQSLAVGCLIATFIVISRISLASVVFVGPLSPYVPLGIVMMLVGAMIYCVVVGVASNYRGMIAVPQEIPATVLGSLGAVVVASSVSAHDEAPFLTMVALMVISSVATGLLLLSLGYFRLSHLFRFIPFPVTAGFFAGTGWVLCLAGLETMMGMTVNWQALPQLLDPSSVWRWSPGVLYAVLLMALARRINTGALLVGSAILFGALQHLVLLWMDISSEEARATGILLSGVGSMDMPHDFGFGDLAHVDWGIVLMLIPELLSVAFVSMLCVIVYVNGLEVATGVDLDLDMEFRAAGVAGLCASASGSVPGYQSFAITLLGRSCGVDNRWLGIMTALGLGLLLSFLDRLLGLIPVSVVGGILLFLGMNLLNDWLIRVRKDVPRTGMGLIVVILVSIAELGFLAGIGVGMFTVFALFAFRLSRVDVIDEAFTLRERSSTAVRSIPDRTILWDRGELARGFRLEGYIFFGAAYPMVERLKQSLSTKPAPKWCLLDFEGVSGCDYSAALTIGQFVRSTMDAGAQVVICAADTPLEHRLRESVQPEVRSALWFEKDFDHGLERCEDLMLASSGMERSGAAPMLRGQLLESAFDDMERYLSEQAQFEDLLERLGPWLEPRRYEVGEILAEYGVVQPGLQFVVSGVVTLHSAGGARLQQCRPGDVIESWAAFIAQAASSTAIARTQCSTMMLTPSARERLEEADNALCLKLFYFLATRQGLRGRLSLSEESEG